MKKIGLDIIGLSYSQTQNGAYALVLGEKNGKRRLPIIIGGFEAQAIAIELEKMTPSRPLTHDLFKSFAETFEINIKEVIIYNLVEGIFFAKLICDTKNKEIEIDARTSDAIAIAVRFNCPIFTYEFILSTSGILLEEEQEALIEKDYETEEIEGTAGEPKEGNLSELSDKDLQLLLDKAITDEAYERASQIRDEINKRKSN